MMADARAFARLMRHLRENDPDHTVIMVQVENETGSHDLARDHAPGVDALFRAEVPGELAEFVAGHGQVWCEAFGPRPEQYFQTWHLARYVEYVAAAGKAEWNLPLYVNTALGNAFTDETGDVGPSGGPNWNVLPVWRAAAPSIGAYGPDLYTRDAEAVATYLDLYAAHGTLMVPKIGNAKEYARVPWPALGRGAAMFTPFGMDATGYSNYPLGAKQLDEEVLEGWAAPYRLLGPAARDWALRIALAGAAPGEQSEILSAEEIRRRWNGDQVDWGFNLGARPVWLKITMGTYQ